MIRGEVDRSGVVATAGTPALYLEDLQIALGCLGETPDCLQVVAQELGVAQLIYGSLERSGARLLLTLTYFDGAQLRVVTRGVEAPAPDAAILDTIPALVREVFGLEALPPDPEPVRLVQATEAPTDPVVEAPAEPEAPRNPHAMRVGAYVLPGVAVAGLGAFVYASTQRGAAEDDYRNAPVGTSTEVNAALADRDEGERMGRVALGTMAAAGASAVGAVILGVVARGRAARTRDEAGLRATIVAGPRVIGFQLRGSL